MLDNQTGNWLVIARYSDNKLVDQASIRGMYKKATYCYIGTAVECLLAPCIKQLARSSRRLFLAVSGSCASVDSCEGGPVSGWLGGCREYKKGGWTALQYFARRPTTVSNPGLYTVHIA